MKKILMAAALICMTMTSTIFTSCGDDKDDTSQKTVVYYKYADVENMLCLQTTDDDVVDMSQRVVDAYNNQMIDGTFKLQRSRNTSEWITVKKFTLNADPKYKN